MAPWIQNSWKLGWRTKVRIWRIWHRSNTDLLPAWHSKVRIWHMSNTNHMGFGTSRNVDPGFMTRILPCSTQLKFLADYPGTNLTPPCGKDHIQVLQNKPHWSHGGGGGVAHRNLLDTGPPLSSVPIQLLPRGSINEGRTYGLQSYKLLSPTMNESIETCENHGHPTDSFIALTSQVTTTQWNQNQRRRKLPVIQNQSGKQTTIICILVSSLSNLATI